MTVIESMNSRIAGAREQRASTQPGTFRSYVIVTLALVCWAAIFAAVGFGLAVFSKFL